MNLVFKKIELVDTRSYMQRFYLKSLPHIIEFSEILSTAQLDSVSIILQVQNTTKSFAMTGYLGALTLMITTGIITILNSQVLYNMIHQT